MALVLDRSVLIGFAFDAIEKGNLQFLKVLLGAKVLASADTNALLEQISGHDLANKIATLEANKSRTIQQGNELAVYTRQLTDLTQRKKQELKTLLSQGLGDDFRDMVPLPESILAMVDNEAYTAHDLTEAFLDPTNTIPPDTIDDNGASLLARAVTANKPQIAEFLILAGADLDFINGDIPTPRQQMRSRTESEWTTLVAKYASKTSPKTLAIKQIENDFVTRVKQICKKTRADHDGIFNSLYTTTRELLAEVGTVESDINQISTGNSSAVDFNNVIARLCRLPNFLNNPDLQLLVNELTREFSLFKDSFKAATPKVAPTPRASVSLIASAPAITRSSGSASFMMGGEASALTMASVQAMVKKETAALVETATAPLRAQLAALEAKNAVLEDKLAQQTVAIAEVQKATGEFSALLTSVRTPGLGNVTYTRTSAPPPKETTSTEPRYT